LSYVKENHGGIFRKLAFSSMLEPFIKFNQDVSTRELKLKELDVRLSELDRCRTLATSLREAQQLRSLQTKSASSRHEQAPMTSSLGHGVIGPVEHLECSDAVFVESTNKTLKITTHLETKAAGGGFNLKKQSVFKLFGSKSNLDKESAETPESEHSRFDNLLVVDRQQLASRRASYISRREGPRLKIFSPLNLTHQNT
jgi:hypothetical protein